MTEILRELTELKGVIHSLGDIGKEATITRAIQCINRQQSEIERLQAECDNIAEDYSDLMIEKDILFDTAEAFMKSKAEVVQEFAEALIQKITGTPTKFVSTYFMYKHGIAFRQEEIINIINEMVGEQG